jgi:hypothetical protein
LKSVVGFHCYWPRSQKLLLLRSPALALLLSLSSALAVSCSKDKKEVTAVTPLVLSQQLLPLNGSFYDAEYLDSYLVIANGQRGVGVVSLANPLAPVEVSAFPVGTDVQRVTGMDRVVYAWDRSQGIKVIDLNEASAPLELTSLPLKQVKDYVNDMLVFPGETPTLYMASHLRGVLGMDLSNLTTPEPVGLNLNGLRSIATQIYRDGENLYLAELGIGISSFHVDAQETLRPLATYALPEGSNIAKFAKRENLIYAMVNSTKEAQSGLSILDLDSASGPAQLSLLPLTNKMLDLVVYPNHVLILVSLSPSEFALQLINTADPSAPYLGASQTFSGAAKLMLAKGEWLHVLVDGAGLMQFQLPKEML